MTDEVLGTPAPPDAVPRPIPDAESRRFFEGLREHRLLILRCADCRYWIHPPLALCPCCHSDDLRHEETSGEARLYSYTVVHHEFARGFRTPYVVALVELVEQQGLRLLTNLVGSRIDDVRVGMTLRPRYWDLDDRTTLVHFAPSDAVGRAATSAR